VRVVSGWPDGAEPSQVQRSFGFHLDVFMAYATGESSAIAFDDYIVQEHFRMAVRAAWQRYYRDIDVFLCPTVFTQAIPHDLRPFEERSIATDEGARPYTDLASWIGHAALPGLPAVSAPIGTEGELPIGLQIIGPMHEDDTAIRFAELLAET
jgi:amidase